MKIKYKKMVLDNKVYGDSLILLFDLVIDKIEGNEEYDLKTLQKILRTEYKLIMKIKINNYIENKIKELREKDEYKNMNEKNLRKIIKKNYM